MLNSINLVGRLTKDPELRKSNSDVSFANFSIAVDNTRVEVDGSRGTCFLDAVAFGTQAEALVKALRKGSKVAISGSLNQRNFVRQDGSQGRAYEIEVKSIEFLDPKPVENNEAKFEDTSKPVNSLDSVDLPDDDLPFKKEETKPQEKVKQKEAKFDPYTGKPLKPKAKK